MDYLSAGSQPGAFLLPGIRPDFNLAFAKTS